MLTQRTDLVHKPYPASGIDHILLKPRKALHELPRIQLVDDRETDGFPIDLFRPSAAELEQDIVPALLEIVLGQAKAFEEFQVWLAEHPRPILVRPPKIMQVAVRKMKRPHMIEFFLQLAHVDDSAEVDVFGAISECRSHKDIGVPKKYELPHRELVEVHVE
jgi:hypothetical protein